MKAIVLSGKVAGWMGHSMIQLLVMTVLMLAVPLMVAAQGPNGEPSDAPTQIVCPGIPQSYAVWPGSMTNSFEWTISGNAGIDWTILSGQGTTQLMVSWANPLSPVTFTVTFTETTPAPASCSSIRTLEVTVQPAPVLIITNPPAVCEPATVDLTSAQVTSGSTLPPGTVLSYWLDAAATLPLNDPAAVAVSGTYYIRASTNSLPSCHDTQPVTVSIEPLPVASIQYPGSPYCANGSATVTLTGQTGGTFSSSAGLVIDPASGEIDLEASIPGSYTVTYAFSNGTCTSSTTTLISIIGMQSASISYPGTPYCATGTAAVLLVGPAGGTFSSGSGLAIDPVTGEVDLEASIPGTYTVNYLVTNGSCSVTSTTTISINSLPGASISYPGNPFCASGTALATVSGQTGGVFSSAAGLSIQPATGEIDLSTSVPGTYTVTYTYSNGTCSNASVTTVTINPLPTASISYTGSPYCATGLASVTQTGQVGGSYSTSPAGCSLDPISGTIDLSSSTPGTYTVFYNFSNGICSSFTSTTITIQAIPVVSLDPVGPVCEGSGPVTLTASPAGGNFSGPGVTGNLFDPGTAGAGTHQVSYSFSNGSCSTVATIFVIVNPSPSTSAIWHN